MFSQSKMAAADILHFECCMTNIKKGEQKSQNRDISPPRGQRRRQWAGPGSQAFTSHPPWTIGLPPSLGPPNI